MIDAVLNLEPNWHPVFVHFVVGLLITAVIMLAVAGLAPQGWPRRPSLQTAGDWMLAIGIAAALTAVAAGFQAYYTVAHDGPSHAAMTDHRNWALAASAAFLLIGFWRYLRRDRAPSILFVLVLIVAAGLLTATAWRGGRLVFHHGLGVASLPEASGPGHDHDHGDGHDHDDGGDAATPADETGDGHKHANGHGPSHGPEKGERATPAKTSDPDPKGTVAAFHAALERGDKAAVRRLVLEDVYIFESGNAERSLNEYAGHHMPADMEFAASVQRNARGQRVLEHGDTSLVLTEAVSKGRFRDQPVHARLMETMFLRRTEEGWRIAHIHWSSAKIEGATKPDSEHDHGDNGHDHEH
jgi:uncharacterized membrane protein/ketosteroid isomerase-like protein